MNEQIQERIMDYVDQIAQGLGVAAEYVLTSWTKFIVLEGVVYTVILLALTAIIFTATIKCIKYVAKMDDKEFDEVWVIPCIILLLLSIVMLVVDIVNLPTYVMQIFVPEYYIIKDVLSFVTGK